jgi:hypothetical protein
MVACNQCELELIPRSQSCFHMLAGSGLDGLAECGNPILQVHKAGISRLICSAVRG